MRTIDSIIRRLGYEQSDNLLYYSDINTCDGLSWHDRRVLVELKPYAVYAIEGSVLALFFDDLNTRGENIHRKIWNSQMPVVISDEGDRVVIYNGKDIATSYEKNVRLQDFVTLDLNQCDEDNDFSYWNLTSSLMSDSYGRNLDKNSLNEFLIDNLMFIIRRLKYDYKVSCANKLMLRILFIRYLIDRGIDIGYMGLNSDVEHSQGIFLEIVRNKEDFFKLTRFLKERFNGNLFEIDNQIEYEELTEESLTMLHDFLTAKEEMKTGQLCLFPFYDFNIIPIELISNIYEILLGKDNKDRDKAFYTPENIADYIVERTVGSFLKEKKQCKILDPACGSGIFLVKSLQMILERNADENGFIKDKKLINDLVCENIYGMDCNEEAVDVTIFSLYVTLFDYQDPKGLDWFKLPLLKEKNIIVGDFFDADKSVLFKKKRFDFILGNPPWGRVDQQKYVEYCKGKNVILQDKEISIAFLLKARELCTEETECSFVIPSKILYKGKKPSIEFRKDILSNTLVKQVLELSAVRKQIFKDAVAPAAIFSFVCRKKTSSHKIEYISLKPNKYWKYFGILMIEPDDIKYVSQDLLLKNDGLWKVLVYGGYWDYELINDLHDSYSSIKHIVDQHEFLMNKGLQDNKGDGKDATHLYGKRILDSKTAIDHFYLDMKAYTIFNKKKIHRPREKEIFSGPYVLFKKGLDCSNYSIKAVYTEDSFLYRDTVNCIKGTKKDENVLLNICGLFNSSLFSYFNLMLGSSVGIEREQIFLNELYNYPYVYSDELVELVKSIQKSESDIEKDKLMSELNQCVLRLFGVQDNYFVNYALFVQIPILCGTYREKKCDISMMKEYASVLSEVWDDYFAKGGIYYKISFAPNIKGKFAAIQVNLSLEGFWENASVGEEDNKDVDLLTKLMIYKLNDYFYQRKDIVEFLEDSFLIVKPNEAKNWHPAVAKKDGYRILNTILQGKGNYK